MNPELGHFRRRWARRWLPGAGRSIRWLAVVAIVALAAPAEAQQGAGSTYGPVRRADTLWELALRFRGDADVNTQQVMIAILRANPEAFREGNINALRTGVTLRVPSAAEMVAITRGEAAAEFARHEEAWRNRRRTGSADPGPPPRTPARPAAATAEAPAGEDEAVAEDLRKAQATVAELRERLSERDEAIEELLAQLAALQRELREQRATAASAPPGGPAAAEDEAATEDAAPRESWLPVSPLILGSSLIVLLVLIVVVTLLRQRGDAEEAPPEEPLNEEGEDGHDEEDGGKAWEEEDERLGAGVEPPAVERREPLPARSGAVGAAVVAATATAAAPGSGLEPGFEPGLEPGSEPGLRPGFGADDETADLQEDETADLPIGMDLEGEEEWGPAPGESSADRPGRRDSEEPIGFGRHVEVGELDDLELDSGPATGSIADLPADIGEQDGSPEGAGPGRPGRVRRG